jgi:hydrogenase nickel incorporation protein HypB
MCTVCGCGAAPAAEVADHDHSHPHDHSHGHDHARRHDHDGERQPHGHHGHDHHHHPHGHGRDDHDHHAPVPPILERTMPTTSADAGGARRIVAIERDILAENDRLAAANRRLFGERRILALNLVSSPGSGKTTLLVETLERLRGRWSIVVIEGDQQTSFDAERIVATGVPAVQINTGRMCHLDARMIGDAVARLSPPDGALLFIENVGNLVCPAGFDLGEAHKVVLLSVTEGDDKPLKYAQMFHAADLMLLTKIDLLPHVRFDVDRCVGFARRVNPKIEVIAVSATAGTGVEGWFAWIAARAAAPMPAAETAALGRF